MRDNLPEKDSPLWLVFATRVYLEIHHILKTEVERPFHDLVEYALEARRTLRGHERWTEKTGLVGHRTDRAEERVSILHDEINDWALYDKILGILNSEMSIRHQRKANVKNNSAKVRVWKENEILKMHPLLCGMWKYCFQLQMQQQGIKLVNDTVIMVAAHLYNALQQGGYLDKDLKWKDAEYLIDIHREDTYLKERPKTMEERMRRMSIVMGASAETFASNRRQGSERMILSKKGPRYLHEMTPIATFFKDRVLNGGDINLSLANINKVISISVKERRKDPHAQALLRSNALQALQAMIEDVWEDVDSDEEGSPDAADGGIDSAELPAIADKMVEDFISQKQFTTVSFIKELSHAMELEVPDLNFDYFAFHRSTWRLLTDLQETCLPHLFNHIPTQDDFATTFMNSTNGAITVPQALISLAADPKKDPVIANVKGAFPPFVVDDSGMKVAAEVFKSFIEREGDAFVRRMRDQELRKKDLELEPYAEPSGCFTGSVGRIDHATDEQSQTILKDVTMEDARRRAIGKWKKEKEEKKLEEAGREEHKKSKKQRQRANRKARKEAEKAGGQENGGGDVADEDGQEKENEKQQSTDEEMPELEAY